MLRRKQFKAIRELIKSGMKNIKCFSMLTLQHYCTALRFGKYIA